VKGFFQAQIPPFRHVLLVESGARFLLEELIPGIYARHPELQRLDVLTCYPGEPCGFDAARGEVLRIADYGGRTGRKRLYRELRTKGYDTGGVISDASPIMFKWKLALLARAPAKFFVLNENCDYFWLDWQHRGILKHFLLFRAGLTGDQALPNILRLLAFPFTLAFLAGYAAWVHARRWARS
jgi:hypothetical protein